MRRMTSKAVNPNARFHCSTVPQTRCYSLDQKHRHSLALALQILAVEAVVEAAGVVALRVALAVVEVAPALQRGRAVLPRVVEVQRAVAVVPAALVLVAQPVAALVVLGLLALRDVARHVQLGGRDVVARPPPEVGRQDVAAQAVEVLGADAAVVGRLGRVPARAAVVAGAGVAAAVGGELALGAGEGRRAQARGTPAARDAGASVATGEAAAGLGVVLAGGAGEALRTQSPVSAGSRRAGRGSVRATGLALAILETIFKTIRPSI